MLDKKPTNEKGQRHGYWEVHFLNGQLWFNTKYVNGMYFGLQEVWFSNGELNIKKYYAR